MIYLCDSCGAKLVEAKICEPLSKVWGANQIPFLTNFECVCGTVCNCMAYPLDEMMVISYTRDGSLAGTDIMSRLFLDGWETLEPLKYHKCGHCCTTLYLPKSKCQ